MEKKMYLLLMPLGKTLLGGVFVLKTIHTFDLNFFLANIFSEKGVELS